MCVDTNDDNWLCSCLAKVCCGILCICCAKSCMDSCNEKQPPPQQMHPGPGPYYGGGNQPMVHYPNNGPYGPPNNGPYGPPNSGPYGPPNPGPYGPVMTTQPTGNYPPPQPNYPMPHAYGAPTAPGSYPPTYTEATKH